MEWRKWKKWRQWCPCLTSFTFKINSEIFLVIVFYAIKICLHSVFSINPHMTKIFTYWSASCFDKWSLRMWACDNFEKTIFQAKSNIGPESALSASRWKLCIIWCTLPLSPRWSLSSIVCPQIGAPKIGTLEMFYSTFARFFVERRKLMCE